MNYKLIKNLIHMGLESNTNHNRIIIIAHAIKIALKDNQDTEIFLLASVASQRGISLNQRKMALYMLLGLIEDEENKTFDNPF